jgi:hypothetical protein
MMCDFRNARLITQVEKPLREGLENKKENKNISVGKPSNECGKVCGRQPQLPDHPKSTVDVVLADS